MVPAVPLGQVRLTAGVSAVGAVVSVQQGRFHQIHVSAVAPRVKRQGLIQQGVGEDFPVQESGRVSGLGGVC